MKTIKDINRVCFNNRTIRLVQQLDTSCRDKGMHSYMQEPGYLDNWNMDYKSEVTLTMGQVFEIMRLANYIKEHQLTVEP